MPEAARLEVEETNLPVEKAIVVRARIAMRVGQERARVAHRSQNRSGFGIEFCRIVEADRLTGSRVPARILFQAAHLLGIKIGMRSAEPPEKLPVLFRAADRSGMHSP